VQLRAVRVAADGFPVAVTCRILGVSRSGFYDWSTRPVSAREQADTALLATITEIHVMSRASYGAPRVHAELRLGLGVACGRKRVARLMRTAGIAGICHRRKRGRDRPLPAPHDDLVQRRFVAEAPDQLWATDITEHPTAGGKVYCCAVIDAYSRMIVGWSIADHMRTELVVDALQMATWRRQPQPGAILHSDRGSQGGFNWSSQHLVISEVLDGASTAGGRSGSAGADEISGPSPVPARDRVRVLGRDRQRPASRAGCARRRRVTSGGLSLVPPRWRHAPLRSDAAHGPVLGVS
jgi:transposase InsO family protein